MSKILITGGAGFIGSTLADRLIAEGEEVAIIDDLSAGRKDYIPAQAKFYREDIGSKHIAEIFRKEKFEVVYHLAAQIEVPKSVADPEHDNEVNLVGGLNILENSRFFGVEKIIFSSTGGAIYGETEEIPTTENCPPYPLSPYGIHKLAFEKYLHYYYRVFDLNYSVLRFANVYGPRQYKGGEAGVIAIFIDNAVKGRPSVQNGDGRQTRDFVYVDDVVAALSLSREIDCRGEMNIASGLETDLLAVRRHIESALGRQIEVQEGPAKLGEQRRSCLSNERAKAVLGWSPKVDLAEGISRTIAWAKEQAGK